jgi:hypothetical protein
MDEDAEQTLIYVDLLGFAKLTMDNPKRVVRWESEGGRFHHAATSSTQNRINQFYSAVDYRVSEEQLNGPVIAMLFSDCAFIALGNPLRAARIAAQLMRDCIIRGVPVRMGLGEGTFYPLGFSTDYDGPQSVVSRSRFIGTAVVNAHQAEQCGGKGMRIFIHPSVESALASHRSEVRTLLLPKPFKHARQELDYLYRDRPASESEKADREDRRLFEEVAAMKNPSDPAKVRRHYTQTHAALNRMRQARSRRKVSTRRMRTGATVDGGS